MFEVLTSSVLPHLSSDSPLSSSNPIDPIGDATSSSNPSRFSPICCYPQFEEMRQVYLNLRDLLESEPCRSWCEFGRKRNLLFRLYVRLMLPYDLSLEQRPEHIRRLSSVEHTSRVTYLFLCCCVHGVSECNKKMCKHTLQHHCSNVSSLSSVFSSEGRRRTERIEIYTTTAVFASPRSTWDLDFTVGGSV